MLNLVFYLLNFLVLFIFIKLIRKIYFIFGFIGLLIVLLGKLNFFGRRLLGILDVVFCNFFDEAVFVFE